MKVLIALLLVTACGSSRPASKSEPAGVVEARTRSHDSLELVYDVRGQGDTALVFVHCWSCDRTFWKNQLDAFAPSYRVVSLDLAGHGQSGATRAAWTIASLGADVQAVIDKLGLNKVIVIGHSMGGPVALDVARRMPGVVRGVVCADTLHDASQKMPAELKEQVLKAFEHDFEGTMRGGIKIMFRPDAPKEVVDWVTTRAVAAKPTVALPLMRELSELDLGPMLDAAKVPIRCINAAPYGPMSPATNIEANKKHADFDAVILDGVGHFLQLEKPEEFNAKLRVILQGFVSP